MSKFHMSNQHNEILDENKILEIIKKGKFITFALCEDKQPYIITLSYGYDKENQCIYVHCADHGLKYEFIKKNHNACATIIEDHGYVLNDCTQKYRSLVIWGKLNIIKDLEEKKHGFTVLFQHLEGESEQMSAKMASEKDAFSGVGMLRFDIEQIDAKGNI